MVYYKDNQNKVWSYSEDQLGHPVVAEAIKYMTLITEAEADELRKPVYTIDELKSMKQAEIITAFDTATKSIADVLPAEMATWRTQEDEARAYVADNTVATPMLSELIIARNMGETVLDLANKVIANADAYRTAYTPLLGKHQSLSNQIALATTNAEVEAIVW